MQVVPGLHLPRFTLEQYKSAYCDVITNTGKSSAKLSNFINTCEQNLPMFAICDTYLLYYIPLLILRAFQ